MIFSDISIQRLQTVAGCALWLIPLMTACTQVAPNEDADTVAETGASLVINADAAGAAFPTYQIATIGRGPSETADRARVLATILLGKDVPSAPFDRFAAAVSGARAAAIGDRAVDVAVSADSDLVASHDPDFDILVVASETVARDTLSPSDVGLAAARASFLAAATRLVQAGILDQTGLDLENPQVSHVIQGEGWMGQPAVERIKEYVFLVPRTLGGVGIRRGTDEAGLRVSVHRNGQIASIKLAGPGRMTKVGQVSRSAARADLDARAKKEFPDSEISADGLRFILHEGVVVSSGDSVPYQTYFVSHTRQDEKGRTIHARGQYVSYRIDDPVASPIVWPKSD